MTLIAPEKFAVPRYSANTEWAPIDNAEVRAVARPFINETSSETVPLMKKRTLPIGVAMLGGTGLTVQVNVTSCPWRAGFGDEVRVAAVLARVMVRLPGAPRMML